MEALAAQARTLLEKWGVAPSHASFVESIAKAIPILSILLTLIVTLNGISSGNVPKSPELSQVRTDVFNKINNVRGTANEVQLDLELNEAAQTLAQKNADSNSSKNTPEREDNLAILQQYLPYSDANAETIVNRFLDSPEHAGPLLEKRNETIGVGVAYNGNRVWVVVEFTVAPADSVESTE